MNQVEVTRMNGDLKREVWNFTLSIDYGRSRIWFDSYSFQTKETSRKRRWIKQTHWDRLDRRNNNIETPSIPSDVEAEMRAQFQQYILTLPIDQ
jgi:hypothetical protein